MILFSVLRRIASQLAFLGLLLGLLGAAHAELSVPALTGHVTDQTGTLTPQQKAALEKTLVEFEARKGSQIAVLLVDSTAPETIEQYSLRVAEQWKLGRAKVDDGVILLIARQDRAMRIEVGYGLEGSLNDAISKRIISETITPHFKQGNFYRGVQAGVGQIMQVIEGEALPPAAGKRQKADSRLDDLLPLFLILTIVAGGLLRKLFGKVAGSVFAGAAVSFMAWMVFSSLAAAVFAGLAATVLSLMGVGTGSHSMGGYSGRSGGWGGGGFGGGGGGFGGGGASGRW